MRRAVVAACLAGLAVTIGACSGSDRGPQAFCTRLQRDRDLLVTGVVDAKTAKAAADHYAALDDVAPEAIRTEWHQLTVLVAAAADLDAAMPTARQALVQQAYTTAPAAATVTTYARQTCGVDLGASAVTTPAATTPAAATPAATIPAVTTPAATTSAGTPAATTRAVTTSAVTTPAVTTSG